jgi:hypothetical protein
MYMMNTKADASRIWVGAAAGHTPVGTREQPYTSIETALKHAGPGKTIVLHPGKYRESISVHTTGQLQHPIRITAEQPGTVEIIDSSWYFYDVSDWIVTDLTFITAPRNALCMIGACQRNSLHSLRFVDCGTPGKASSSVFFGGSQARCNKVENCEFIRRDSTGSRSPRDAQVAILISEGNVRDNEKNSDFIIRHNTINNYDYGIIAGTGDTGHVPHAHLIEDNQISDCRFGGITIKCGDTRIRANVISHCHSHAISVWHCNEIKAENNRILDSARGLVLNGSSHTCQNNCFIRCHDGAVTVAAEETCAQPRNTLRYAQNTGPNAAPDTTRDTTRDTKQESHRDTAMHTAAGTAHSALKRPHTGADGVDDTREADTPAHKPVLNENIMIANNSFITCTTRERQHIPAIVLDGASTCIIFRNLFHESLPFQAHTLHAPKKARTMHVIRDNVTTPLVHLDIEPAAGVRGVEEQQIDFNDIEQDDVTTHSTYGAHSSSTAPFSITRYSRDEERTQKRRDHGTVFAHTPEAPLSHMQDFFDTQDPSS